MSNKNLLFLELQISGNKISNVNLKTRDDEYLFQVNDYLVENDLTTHERPLNFILLNTDFGVYGKRYAPYYLLMHQGRTFELNKEFGDEPVRDYNSFVWRNDFYIRNCLSQLGINTSNMFIKDSEDGKHIELGVITSGKTHSFKIDKDITRYNHLLVSFINQVLRDHGLKDRAIKTNSDIFESEDYVIMPPKKLEHMLKAYPELARI